ncbi:MAG: energy-coupling factor transporter transmembrane component T [Candidatus Riflebacteria bacterium]|nr:energy-coupling factor transporter transmembrane component T [Candidatus Riflebacteria bacterium]
MQISYKPGNSFLYALNPLLKGMVAFALIMFFSVNDLSAPAMAVALFVPLLTAIVADVPIRDIIGSIKRIALLLLIVALIQGFRDGAFDVMLALEAIIRILGVFVTAGIYVTISSQSELMYFWEICFRPFALLGLPARELALVMVIAVRFLPVILAEIDRIRMAQIARGAKLENGGFFASAASLMPLMIPTLSQAIIRAGELAEAMEARGYRVASARTRYHHYKITLLDTIAAVLSILMVFSVIYAKF